MSNSRINEIEQNIERLQKERDRLWWIWFGAMCIISAIVLSICIALAQRG